MRFPAPVRLGQPAAPRDATWPRAGRLVGAAGLAAGLAGLLPGAAVAQNACPPAPEEMCDLGTLRSDNLEESSARGVTANRAVIVGRAAADDGARAFRWTDDGSGMQDLGTLRSDNLGPSFAFGVSADGTVIVGWADTDDGIRRAFRWTDDGSGMQDLGTLHSDNLGFSEARAVSADGTVIVGWATTDDGFGRAFGWTDDGSGMQDLGTLRSDNLEDSNAYGVSADGTVIVGEAETDDGDDRAFRWTDDGSGMQDLGTLRSDNLGPSVAFDVSADGSVIVGWAETDSGDIRAVRWTDDGSGMQDLGTLRSDNLGLRIATGVSADGSVIVGWGETDGGSTRAVRWTDDGSGMQDLGTLRTDNSGFSLAYDVTADGSIVVGEAQNDDGENRAFIWRADTMLDHVNTGIAVQQSAQALAATAAHYGQTTVYQLGREVTLRAPGGGDSARVSTRGEAAPRRPVAVRVGGRLAHTDDVATSGGAEVTAAVGLTPTLTLGGFVEVTGESDSHSVVSLDGTHIAGGASLRYRGAPDGTGLTWRVAAVRGGGDFDVTRQDILPNTERGEGATSLTTTGLSAEIGYGYAVPRGTVTPFARLTGSRVERDGFAESDAIAFPLTYDAHEDEALTLTLGADARLDVSARGTLELGAGISHDLDRDTDPVTGTSAIPGFTNFSVAGPDLENRTRGHVSAGYSHALGAGRAVSGSVSLSQSPWTDDVSVGARLGYEMRF